MRLDGGRGDDLITATYTGDLDGRLNFRADGGGGDDEVVANINLATGSEGEVRARVLGGRGDDTLTLNVLDPDENADVDALLDGGAGFDTCVATDNVDVVNCEA